MNDNKLSCEQDVTLPASAITQIAEVLSQISLQLSPNSNSETMLDFNGACSFLNVKPSFLRKLIFRKSIPFFKFGRVLRFSKKDLMAWMEERSF